LIPFAYLKNIQEKNILKGQKQANIHVTLLVKIQVIFGLFQM